VVSERTRFDARPNPLATAIAAHARSGRPILDLTESNPTRAGVPYPKDRIREAIAARDALEYEPQPFGLPKARDAVANLWRSRGLPVDASRIAMTASTSEAYGFLFKLLCDPGDRVLVPAPSYPLFEHLARYEGVEVAPYRLDYDGGWYVDIGSLRASATPRARAIVAVTPNNPTGSFLKRDELERIGELGLPIISDEVFAAYSFTEDPRRACSALELEGPLVFALDGLSKFALLPQMKLAWVTAAGPTSAVSEALSALELLLDTYLSPSTPVQQALPSLLEASEAPRAYVRERTRRNLAFLDGVVRGTSMTRLDAEGGWYAVLRLPNVRTEEDWVVGLLGERDVLVQPGWFYDFGTEPYAVVSLLTRETVFRDGVGRIVGYVRSSS